MPLMGMKLKMVIMTAVRSFFIITIFNFIPISGITNNSFDINLKTFSIIIVIAIFMSHHIKIMVRQYSVVHFNLGVQQIFHLINYSCISFRGSLENGTRSTMEGKSIKQYLF